MGYYSDCHKFMSVILVFPDSGNSESVCEMKLEKNDQVGDGRRGKESLPTLPCSLTLLSKEKE